MSDQNLNIGINVTTTGDGAKRAAEGLKEVAAAQDRLVKDGYPATWEAAKKDEEVTKKAATAKDTLKDAMKGLALEFPVLARVVNLAISPLSGLIAVLGTLVAATMSYIRSVDEAQTKSQALATIGERVDTLRQITQEMTAANEDFAETYNALTNQAGGASEAVTRFTQALLVQQRIAQELDDAGLQNELARIDASNAPEAEKVQQRAAAQQGARERKTARELETLRTQATVEFNQANAAARQRDAAEAAVPGVEARLVAQTDNVNRAAEIAKVAQGDAERLPQLRRLQELFTRMQEGKAGPLEAAELISKGEFTGSTEENLTKVQAEIAGINKGIADATLVVKQEKAKQAAIEREITALQQRVLEQERTRQRLTESAEGRSRELELRGSAAGTVNEINRSTDEIRTNRQVQEIQAREEEALRRRATQWQRGAQPGEAMPSEFQRFIRDGQFDPTASVQQAGDGAIEQVALMGSEVAGKFNELAAALAEQRARIARLEGGDQAGLIG